ncbi:hypothetical protein I6N90_00630 [Paenibacillus sp. GSMTC-2017]|uniref:hypothetical protein n=1 Tax=Paenibacillus sp. GSMTC-2017 TaxID=2794350 RepID=UPI0018D7E40B|nr:hypothetical protein [Paenibacillus sp. GSMTC-2017]MBH5316312.1 hypothetical protein [Paenibacillus sp. GSMTC-2017]
MNQSEPDWYDDLHGNPLRKKTFTNDLADKIRARTLPTVKAPPKNYRKYWVGGATLLAIGFLLFTSDAPIFDRLPSSATTGIDLSKEDNIIMPSDSKLMNLINKEKEDGYQQYFLHKEIIDGTSMLLFTNKFVTGQGRMILSAGFATWTSSKLIWTEERLGEIDIDYVTADEYEKAFLKRDVMRFSGQKISIPSDSSSHLLFGPVWSHHVTKVRITDENNIQYDVKVVDPELVSYKIWYSFIPFTQGIINVEALDKDDLVLDRIEIK